MLNRATSRAVSSDLRAVPVPVTVGPEHAQAQPVSFAETRPALAPAPAELMTLAEVAQLCRVTPATISKWSLQDSSFPLIKLPGRVHLVERAALWRWLRSHGRRTAPSRAQTLSKSA